MQHRSTLKQISMGFGLVVAVGAFAHPAPAQTYSWQTEDGVYAYTDDPKHIPARYAAEAKPVRLRGLESYGRYTAQDNAATERYASRLGQRLEYLRAANAASEQAAAPAGIASNGAPQRVLSFSTGGTNDPRLELPVSANNSAPVVVEHIHSKRTGDPRTRRSTVVKQDGEVIAVFKGIPHVHNPSLDFHDEEALDRGEE